MKTRILYFASLRDFLQREEDQYELPENVKTVDGLKRWLSKQDESLKKAFETMPRLRSAVNQEMAENETAVKNGDEVAFFPPVTGG
ncbi:MAG: molybdopterin converting factor subunit 1 [Burkholderiaceae bacterium]|nr:molybdopterin converting factor subunit 1 [Burkholderiaceae bacterium]